MLQQSGNIVVLVKAVILLSIAEVQNTTDTSHAIKY